MRPDSTLAAPGRGELAAALARIRLRDSVLSVRATTADIERELRERGLRGWWARFPVCPAKFDVRIRLFPEGCEFLHRIPFTLASRLMLGRWRSFERAAAAAEPAERLALHRAALTLISELGERYPWDVDGCGPGWLMEEVSRAYYLLPWTETGIEPEVYIRDGIEFVIWCDAIRHTNNYYLYENIPKGHGELLESIFAEMLADLSARGFTDHIRRLRDQWATFLAAHARYDDFVPLARAIGSDDSNTVLFLAECASDHSERLALEVFSAANRPGPEQDQIISACRMFLDRDPEPWQPDA